MRLVGTVETEKLAFKFYSFLLQEQIESSYEVVINPTSHKEEFLIWIYDEDAFEKALSFFKEFQKDPTSSPFAIAIPSPPPLPSLVQEHIKQEESIEEESLEQKEKKRSFFFSIKKRQRPLHPLTFFLLFLMVVLYVWNIGEQEKKPYPPSTPLEKVLFFDYTLYQEKLDALLHTTPASVAPNPIELTEIQKIPHWQGIAFLFNTSVKKPLLSPPSLFEITPKKIANEHQWWRVFTPVLLHHDFFHILFNLLIAFSLLKQIEERIPRWKMVFLIIAIGSFSNVCQYLIGGPNFIGFSGIVCGLVGFIRVRQKVAPWEGYPMSKSFFVFILTYIIVMVLLEIGSIEILRLLGKARSIGIANTAHVTGTLFGALLGRMPLFVRKFR